MFDDDMDTTLNHFKTSFPDQSFSQTKKGKDAHPKSNLVEYNCFRRPFCYQTQNDLPVIIICSHFFYFIFGGS